MPVRHDIGLRDLGGSPGGAEHIRHFGIFGVRISCLVTLQDPDSDTIVDVESSGGHFMVPQQQVIVYRMFEIEVGKVASL